MVYVSAAVKIRVGMLSQALDIYREFVPRVLANEPACLEYTPTLDCDLGLSNQQIGPETIVVRESWQTIEAFRMHLTLEHSIEFRAAIQPCLAERITIRVFRDAL